MITLPMKSCEAVGNVQPGGVKHGLEWSVNPSFIVEVLVFLSCGGGQTETSKQTNNHLPHLNKTPHVSPNETRLY